MALDLDGTFAAYPAGHRRKLRSAALRELGRAEVDEARVAYIGNGIPRLVNACSPVRRRPSRSRRCSSMRCRVSSATTQRLSCSGRYRFLA